jgi:hypothetical protein
MSLDIRSSLPRVWLMKIFALYLVIFFVALVVYYLRMEAVRFRSVVFFLN